MRGWLYGLALAGGWMGWAGARVGWGCAVLVCGLGVSRHGGWVREEAAVER